MFVQLNQQTTVDHKKVNFPLNKFQMSQSKTEITGTECKWKTAEGKVLGFKK